MKIKNLLKSVSGFSMVEIMVAAALLGGLSLGVVKLMENANKASKTIEVKDDIIQMERLITDVLNSPNNCEATLGEKTIGSNIPVIYQVINNQPVPKFSVSTAKSNSIQITSMKIKNVDANGSDGSTALASLEVTFKKPNGALGGSDIKKEIVLNANLCQKKWIKNTDVKLLVNQCTGKIVDGPNKWGTTYWAACQDCSMLSSKTIYSCQSRGGLGVDIGNISKIACYNLGGTFDDVTSNCDIKEKVTQDSCYALGGQINTQGECKFNNGQFTLAQFIQDLAKKETPDCIVLPACTPKYPTQGGRFTVTAPVSANYTEYTISCTANYKRYWWQGGWFNAPDAKSLLCASNYSQYGTTSASCSTVSRNASATCYQADWILSCSGCGSGCFHKTSQSCTTTSSVVKTETIPGTVTLYNCCR
jgi:type II secretory pathway pseudopilin PulG